MPLEMKLLVWSAVLAVAQTFVAAVGTISQVGFVTAAGNRENMPVFTGWVGRAHRAHHNLLENLVLFAILVLAAQALNRLNAATALGAELFFGARVAYAAIYVAGIPWVRTLLYAISLVGLVLIFLQLL